MRNRLTGPIGGIVGMAVVALLLPAGAVAAPRRATDPATPIPAVFAAVTIRSRATISPLPTFTVRPFAIAAVTIQTLAWPDLPMNGNPLLSLKVPPNSDADGIAYKIVDGRRVYSPGNLGSDGIRYVDAYVRTGDPAYLDRAVVRAKKLVSMSRLARGGRWFPYLYDHPSEKLRAPWYSAYSQGFALSLFVRLYRVTGGQAWADRARETAMSFRRLGRTIQPWVSYVRTNRLWLEEYPSSTPTHVLNGFNFALFGLYDYERLTRDPVARELLRGALRTMRSYGTSYRVPGGVSLYDLVHRTQFIKYHRIHIWQLRDLSLISGDSWYRRLAGQLWLDYH
jgi:hypothetical protein